jgi:hypothetical protein
MSRTGGGWKRKPTAEELTTMVHRPEDIEPWLDPASAEVTVYHMWDESVAGVKAIDTLTFTNALGHPLGAFGATKYVVCGVERPRGHDRPRPVVPGPVRPARSCTGRWRARTWPRPTSWRPRWSASSAWPAARTPPWRTSRSEGWRNTPLRTGGFGAFNFDGAVALHETRGGLLRDLVITNVNGHGVRTDGVAGVRVEGCEVHHTGACGLAVWPLSAVGPGSRSARGPLPSPQMSLGSSIHAGILRRPICRQ